MWTAPPQMQCIGSPLSKPHGLLRVADVAVQVEAERVESAVSCCFDYSNEINQNKYNFLHSGNRGAAKNQPAFARPWSFSRTRKGWDGW